jgi:hypothetical protein
VKNVLVDYRITETEEINLYKLGYHSIKVPPSKVLYEAVSGHPDMLLHKLTSEEILVHKSMPKNFINTLISFNYKVMTTHKGLCDSYPNDILLNAVNLDTLFMHNLKYTDPVLLKAVRGKKQINVKQGYTKCSTAIINNKAVITSDICISKALNHEGVDVLLLPPKDILLKGLDYGFIGGSCGLLDGGTLAFYGNLQKYKYGNEVLNFLLKHDVKPVYLSDENLIDRGTIISI